MAPAEGLPVHGPGRRRRLRHRGTARRGQARPRRPQSVERRLPAPRTRCWRSSSSPMRTIARSRSSGRKENDPVTMDCPTPDKNAAFNCYNPDYRCIARDLRVRRAAEPDRPQDRLQREGVQLPGAGRHLRQLPPVAAPSQQAAGQRHLVAGRSAPTRRQTTPDSSSSPNQRRDQVRHAEPRGADAACSNTVDSTIFGRPQVRLSKFIPQFPDSIEQSVCDTGNYASALNNIAANIEIKVGTQCMGKAPKTVAGVPACVVEEVAAADPQGPALGALPLCGIDCCTAWAESSLPSTKDDGIQRRLRQRGGGLLLRGAQRQPRHLRREHHRRHLAQGPSADE